MALTQVPIELSSTPGIVDNSNATAITIDSSENVMVGTTDTAPGAGDTNEGFSINSSRVFVSRASDYSLSLNRTTDDGPIAIFRKDGTTVGSVACRSSGGNLQIHTNQSGIDFGGDGYLPMRGSTITDNSLDIGSSSFRYKDLFLSSKVRLQYPGNSYYARVEVDSSTNLIFGAGANGSERARITSAGNLLVGRTSAGTTGNGHSIRGGDSAIFSRDSSGESMIVARNSSVGDIIRLYAGGVDKGSINFDGGSTISYTSGSDQRLKENIVDAPSASDDIDAIQVRSFDWKSNGAHQKYGMIAQELETVAPVAVSGDADSDEMMGVDYSKLVPMLVKEIQSLRTRVAQLENN
jgi:hypothetical protein